MPDEEDIAFRRLKRLRERGQLPGNQRRFLLQSRVEDDDGSREKNHDGGLKKVQGNKRLVYYSA